MSKFILEFKDQTDSEPTWKYTIRLGFQFQINQDHEELFNLDYTLTPEQYNKILVLAAMMNYRIRGTYNQWYTLNIVHMDSIQDVLNTFH
jgi:hypothetical protein